MDTSDYIKLAAYRELQEALMVKRVNDELLEFLCASIRWFVRYASKNGIHLPDIDRVNHILSVIREIESKNPISDDSLQSDRDG